MAHAWEDEGQGSGLRLIHGGLAPRRGDSYEDARAFLRRIGEGARVVVTYHGDADGTASAVLALRTLERMGHEGFALAPGKGESLQGLSHTHRLRGLLPERLLVLDQGSRPRPVLPEVPTLVVDHHDAPPEGVPVDVYLSGLCEEPVPTTSVMVWRLLSPMVDLEGLDWLTAVGAIGDLGPAAPFPEVAEAKKRYGQKNLVETVALVNAAKRSAAHDTATSLAALLVAETPADIAKGRVRQHAALVAYRKEVQAERARCARTAPVFSGDWALLRFSSPCQVHGLIAASWTGRLPRYIVMAANEGYTPGSVHFSIRSRRPDEDLLERLRAFRDATGAPELGQGHAQATGGTLPIEQFEYLLEALGFPVERGEVRRAA